MFESHAKMASALGNCVRLAHNLPPSGPTRLRVLLNRFAAPPEHVVFEVSQE